MSDQGKLSGNAFADLIIITFFWVFSETSPTFSVYLFIYLLIYLFIYLFAIHFTLTK